MPAVLGPEYAYRELRRSDLDYLEISEPDEAKDAVLRLREDTRLYSAMVENGRRRAREFTAEKILARWAVLLFDRIPRLVAERRLSPFLPHSWRAGGRLLTRTLTGLPRR